MLPNGRMRALEQNVVNFKAHRLLTDQEDNPALVQSDDRYTFLTESTENTACCNTHVYCNTGVPVYRNAVFSVLSAVRNVYLDATM